MNKLLAALIAGFFSIGAFAQAAAPMEKPMDKMEKPMAAHKAGKHMAKKGHKAGTHMKKTGHKKAAMKKDM